MISSAWRADLAAAIARGVEASGLAAVADALAEEVTALEGHPDAPVEPFRPTAAVIGLVPCATGCLGVLVQPDGRVSVHVARTADALLDQVRETVQPEVVVEGTVAADPEVHRDLVLRAGLPVPAWFSGSGFTADELVAACAAVVAAG